jgi:GntR family transcriptional regulator / MocR family aminotransferase
MYGLSRGTVNTVYETLATEGYLLSQVGRGTSVSGVVRSGETTAQELPKSIPLSDWGRRLDKLPLRTARETGQPPISEAGAGSEGGGIIHFETGIPDLQLFPFADWNRLLYAGVREMGASHTQMPFQAQGDSGLREAVAVYLNRYRGLNINSRQVVIVNGSMQAIALLCQLMVNPGDEAAVENPGYSGIRRAIEAQGGIPVLLPPGRDFIVGLKASSARIAFVTPGRQFPTGSVMHPEDRLQLLAWASGAGGIIVEDDYDSEFRHRGRPLEPLKALDRAGTVVYIGTFTKTLPPGHRIGYAVLPHPLVEPFIKAKQLFEPHPTALLEQRALARFMQSGQYERHLRRMNRVYGARFHLLKESLEHRLGDCLEVVESDSGLHLFAWWKYSMEMWVSYKEACNRGGVYWSDTSSYFANKPLPSGCFGFSHLTDGEIEDGVNRMALAWSKLKL